MAKQSPLERVKAEHGSKAALAKAVTAILERREDEEADEFAHRVETMSNRKLLRLLDAHKLMEAKFGSKQDLVSKIVRARFPGGNTDYETKISGFTLPKLLDMARTQKLLRPCDFKR